jgi:hypothetical protein
MQLHFWLETTAYFKMPKGQEQELIGAQSCSLEKVKCSLGLMQACL